MDGFQVPESATLNDLSYCEAHGREICHDCPTDCVYMNEFYFAFKLPEKGIPEYPTVLQNIGDNQLRKYLGKRWLDMQKVLYPGQPALVTTNLIKLPPVDVPDEIKASPSALQGTLLRLFQNLKGMASTQRYYFANQSKIILQDYEIFIKAAILYDEEVSDGLSRKFSLMALRGNPNPSEADRRHEHMKKTRASVLNTFGYFMELNTQRTFWRIMELTVDAFMLHIESFNEEADGQVVVTDKAKGSFLQWLASFYWALQHAQFQLNGLRAIQLEVFQRQAFPFFPYIFKALEENADIHLIIAKLSKVPVHDLSLFSSLFSELQQASSITEQMQTINPDLMAAIDELSTRFRVLETLILAAHLVATEGEIKSALVTFKFEPAGKEVNSRTDDVFYMLTGIESETRGPVPKKLSLLQKLIVKENLFRQQKEERVVRPPYTTDRLNGFSKDMFDAFKSNYTSLYRESIRRQWKEEEYSLLGLDVARRFQHRQDIEKKKKKKRALSLSSYEKVDMGEVRSVPEAVNQDPSMFWEIGDGTLEKYVPPVIRKKLKTRKQDISSTDEQAGMEGVKEGVPILSDAAADLEDKSPKVVQRPLDQLKHTDLVTRDILWRKIKGCLKWGNLVQFLSRLGCKILNLDGSKRKIVDNASGRCTVLHRPHPGDECRPDQRESYRVHIEDWLKIDYSDLVPQNDAGDNKSLDSIASSSTVTDAQAST